MTSLPEIGTILQCALVTWIIWETVRDHVAKRLKPDYHIIPVAVLAAVVYATIPLIGAAHNVLTAVALVALLHYLLSRVERRR